MKTPYAWFEQAIGTLERALGVEITIIDNQGLFHTPAGRIIFPLGRQSHRKLPVCDSGFSSKCVDFCRHEMNRQCLSRHTPFTKTCWKGITEIVVPLRRGEEHWGMFYLGAWRTPGFVRAEEAALPVEFDDFYRSLPRWSKGKLQEWSPLLEAFAAGIIARLAELNATAFPPADRASQIMSYINQHAVSHGTERAQLTGLALELHLSVSRTSRIVGQYFQRSFTTLLNEVRINRAKVLLLSSEEKLASIAAATGFGDEYHFSRIFRKLTGEPPGRYRQRLRSSAPGG